MKDGIECAEQFVQEKKEILMLVQTGGLEAEPPRIKTKSLFQGEGPRGGGATDCNTQVVDL